MKKILLIAIIAFSSSLFHAQYAEIDARLKKLEEKNGIVTNIENIDLNQKRFVIQKEFEDHTERMFISIEGDKARFIEVFDDKQSGESSSNIFTGDYLKTQNNIFAFRFDHLEGEKIALPITKNFLVTQQGKTLYLIDVNTKERWIDEKRVRRK